MHAFHDIWLIWGVWPNTFLQPVSLAKEVGISAVGQVAKDSNGERYQHVQAHSARDTITTAAYNNGHLCTKSTIRALNNQENNDVLLSNITLVVDVRSAVNPIQLLWNFTVPMYDQELIRPQLSTSPLCQS